MTTEATLYQNILKALDAAIRTTDAPWALNRPRAIARTRSAVIDAITPILVKAVTNAEIVGQITGRAARDTDLVAQADAGFEAGREAGLRDGLALGRLQGRREALAEAAVMLKRHGHRTAVDRVQALATPQTAPEPTDAPPSAPRPAYDPQNGTGAQTRNTPQEALEGPSGPRTPTGPSTDTATGPSAALRGRPAPAARRA